MPSQYRNAFEEVSNRLNLDVNPFVRKLIEGQENGKISAIQGPIIAEWKGRWREKIAAHYGLPADSFQELILEIGCHKGKTLIEMAEKRPKTAFVGLDITFKRVVTSAERASKRNLKNLFTALASAKQLTEIFDEGEISGVVAFFPDPWTKKKSQNHHQLFSEDFIATLTTRMRPGGFFWFKSDSLSYFESVKRHCQQTGLVTPEKRQGIYAETYQSSFEKRFTAMKIPHFEGVWVNPPVH